MDAKELQRVETPGKSPNPNPNPNPDPSAPEAAVVVRNGAFAWDESASRLLCYNILHLVTFLLRLCEVDTA